MFEHKYGYESERARVFPPYVMYDVINVCNAKCIHCPQSMIAAENNFVAQRLLWGDFERTVTEVARYDVDVVRFTGDGEPLMHPEMARMIARTRELNLRRVNLTTNGSLLSGKRLDELLKNPPHVFDVSLDAFYPETFARVRVGLDFDEVKGNVMELLRRRNAAETKVVVSIVQQPGMDQEIREFEAHWKNKVDFVAVRGLHTNLGLSGAMELPSEIERWPCIHLWQRLVIDFRGHIRYCPVDWRDLTKIGKVSEMSLYDAWHSPAQESLRDKHMRNDYSGCGACTKCKDWAQSPWDKGWLQLMRNVKVTQPQA